MAPNWPSQFCWSFCLSQAQGPYFRFSSFLTSTWPACSPPLQQPQTHRFMPAPSSVLWVHIMAIHSVYSPWCLGCVLGGPPRCILSPVPRIWAWCSPHPTGVLGTRVERRLELLLQENSSNCPWVSLFSLFHFEKFLLLNPATPYKKGPILSHSPPLQLEWGLSGSGPHTAQLSTIPSHCLQSPWIYHFVLIHLLVTSSNQVFLSAAQTLFCGGGSN